MNNGNVSWINGGELLLAFVCFIAAWKREEEDDGCYRRWSWSRRGYATKIGGSLYGGEVNLDCCSGFGYLVDNAGF